MWLAFEFFYEESLGGCCLVLEKQERGLKVKNVCKASNRVTLVELSGSLWITHDVVKFSNSWDAILK